MKSFAYKRFVPDKRKTALRGGKNTEAIRIGAAAVYSAVAHFGESYADGVMKILRFLFKKPLSLSFFLLKKLLLLPIVFAAAVFKPAGADNGKYIRDVKKALKTCTATALCRPLSFFPTVSGCVKAGIKKYRVGAKSVLLWLLPVTAILLFAAGVKEFSDKSIALKISIGGENIGCVAAEKDFFEAKNAALRILNTDGNKAVVPDVTYSLTLAGTNDFTDENSLTKKLAEKSSAGLVKACGVYADGLFLAALYSEAHSREVFENILAQKKTDGKNYITAFDCRIEYREGLFPAAQVISPEALRKRLLYGEDRTAFCLSERGDTLTAVAKAREIEPKELFSLNPQLDKEKELAEGTEIRLKPFNLLPPVKEVKSVVSSESVDFPVKEIKSNTLYRGSTKLLSQGEKGYEQVTRLVTSINGEVKDTKEISRLTLKEPVPKRLQVGIKELDEKYTTSMGGILVWPVVGAYGINSPYGPRWGKIHRGIDIGMGNSPGSCFGKTVVAAAAGTVTTARSLSTGYGTHVIIDHGGGMQTVYGHCIKGSLAVVPGQHVAAGQPIARVGQTGFATGPHLHFEVRINGNKVNPAPYLGI